jgi:hypothetical protein
MFKIVALTESRSDEEHQEEETITQVTKEAQVSLKIIRNAKTFSSYSTNLYKFRKRSQFLNT